MVVFLAEMFEIPAFSGCFDSSSTAFLNASGVGAVPAGSENTTLEELDEPPPKLSGPVLAGGVFPLTAVIT
jgi:hypothetical protein